MKASLPHAMCVAGTSWRTSRDRDHSLDAGRRERLGHRLGERPVVRRDVDGLVRLKRNAKERGLYALRRFRELDLVAQIAFDDLAGRSGLCTELRAIADEHANGDR